MAVRIRLKRLGRKHRPFYRICAMDSRVPRDGKAIEELGHYDPMERETDARAVLKADRIDHWLSVGAKPTEKVAVLIKKYGTGGTHLDQQQAAIEKLKRERTRVAPMAAEAQSAAPAEEEAAEEAPAAEEPAAEAEATEEASE